MRPKREHATNYGQTYMVTTETWGRRALFRAEPWARLMMETLYHYRGSAYLLHAFVVMPDHIHVILTPKMSLEKAVQFIKGGFSYRAKKELGSNIEVWQKGFSDHRIRDTEDYARHVVYINENPVRKHLCEVPGQYPYSSEHQGFEVDESPQGLKPRSSQTAICAAEAAPLQNRLKLSGPEGVPFQNSVEPMGAFEGGPFRNTANEFDKTDVASSQGLKPRSLETAIGAAEAAPLQNRAGLASGDEAAPLQNMKNNKEVA